MELKDVVWKRVEHGLIDEPIIDYLERIIETEHALGHKLKICVGTDSQKKGGKFKFAIAIIVEVKQPMGKLGSKEIYKGLGAKVISGVYMENYRPTLKERMLKEVQMSINVCYHILDLVELYEVDMEIHADVNPNPMWASNIAFTEAVGYMKGMGFKFKTKPDAYAASSGADRLCNN